MKMRKTRGAATGRTARETCPQPTPDEDLVDVSKLACEAGLGCLVGLTRVAWANCVAWSEEDNDRKNTAQDETGRLWDVLFMCNIALRHDCWDGALLRFEVYSVPRAGRGAEPQRIQLAAEVDVDSHGERHLTIGLPEEFPSDDPPTVVTVSATTRSSTRRAAGKHRVRLPR